MHQYWRADDRQDEDGAHVPARDVRADREPATCRRELLGEQAVADRVLRRPADTREDVGHRERYEARR
jgi:hypothetical protein